MWEVLGVGCRERFNGDIMSGDPCSSPCPGADSGPGTGVAVVVTMAKLSLC